MRSFAARSESRVILVFISLVARYSKRMAFQAHSDTYSQASMWWRWTTTTSSPAIFKLDKFDVHRSPPIPTSNAHPPPKHAVCLLRPATFSSTTLTPARRYLHTIAILPDHQTHRRQPRALQPIKSWLLFKFVPRFTFQVTLRRSLRSYLYLSFRPRS